MSHTTEVPIEDEDVIRDLYLPLRRFAGVVGSPTLDPDDLLQEALVRVLRTVKLHELDNPGAYLRQTIVNLAASAWRRRARERRALRRLAATDGDVAPAAYPSDVADLLQLEPRARAVLYLHDIEGHDFIEVARLVDMRQGAARMLASRSRRRLRTLLESEASR